MLRGISNTTTIKLAPDISFKGLKENLRLGEQVLKDFKREYPNVKSNVLVDVKASAHEDDPRYQKLLPRLRKVESVYAKGVNEYRKKRLLTPYSSVDDYVRELKTDFSAGGFANCQARAVVIESELHKRGVTPCNIGVEFPDSRTGFVRSSKSHVFTVFGLKKDARTKEPGTWGQEAVIVDAWAGIVMPAREAIDYYKILFRHSPAQEDVKFRLKKTKDLIL